MRLGTVPPLPAIPKDLHWRPAIAVASCYAGAIEEGERALEALADSGRRLSTSSGPRRTSITSGAPMTPFPTGWHYWKATNLHAISDEVIDVIVDHFYGANSRGRTR